MCGEKVSDKNELELYLDIFLQAINCYTPDKYVNKIDELLLVKQNELLEV